MLPPCYGNPLIRGMHLTNSNCCTASVADWIGRSRRLSTILHRHGNDSWQECRRYLQRTFGFVPEWVIGLGLVCLAIVCALFVHRNRGRLSQRRAIGLRRSIAIFRFWMPPRDRRDWRSASPQSHSCCRSRPLSDELRDTLTHLFVVASIALIGWILIRGRRPDGVTLSPAVPAGCRGEFSRTPSTSTQVRVFQARDRPRSSSSSRFRRR